MPHAVRIVDQEQFQPENAPADDRFIEGALGLAGECVAIELVQRLPVLGRSLSCTLGAGGTTGWNKVSISVLALECETVSCNCGATAARPCAKRMLTLKLENNAPRGLA